MLLDEPIETKLGHAAIDDGNYVRTNFVHGGQGDAMLGKFHLKKDEIKAQASS